MKNLTRAELIERLGWLATAERGAQFPDIWRNDDNRGSWDQGMRETAIAALRELALGQSGPLKSVGLEGPMVQPTIPSDKELGIVDDLVADKGTPVEEADNLMDQQQAGLARQASAANLVSQLGAQQQQVGSAAIQYADGTRTVASGDVIAAGSLDDPRLPKVEP